MTNHVLKRYEVILDEKAQKVLATTADRYGVTVADFLISIVEDRLCEEVMKEEIAAHHRNFSHTITGLTKDIIQNKEDIAAAVEALGNAHRKLEEAESNKKMVEFRLQEATTKAKARGRGKLGL